MQVIHASNTSSGEEYMKWTTMSILNDMLSDPLFNIMANLAVQW